MNGGQLLLECDGHGQVLWMNLPARRRFGLSANLLDSISEAERSKAAALLTPKGDTDISCSFSRAGDTFPVRLRRVLFYGDHVILLALPAQRASDSLFRDRALLDAGMPLVSRLPKLTRCLVRVEKEKAEARAPGRRAGRLIAREVERERTRIARILHAGAGQGLAGIKLNLDIIGALGFDMPPRAVECLDRIRTLSDETMEQLRGVSHALHPPAWQSLTIQQALERLWVTTGIRDKYEATLELEPLPAEPCHWIRIAIYRSCQEALSNVVRHSGASRVSLRMRGSGDRVIVAVEDDGCGIPPRSSAPNEENDGIGLTSMRDQALELGGNVDVRSGPGGTRVEISFPYTEVA